MAGTPSIVAGVVAYALVVIPTGHFSAIAGGVALGLLMFPTVTRATEEAVKLVPPSIREAGLALGIPEWQTMVRIILPAAANGIVTAVMLGIGRVSGETAPLLFTAFGQPQRQLQSERAGRRTAAFRSGVSPPRRTPTGSGRHGPARSCSSPSSSSSI